MAKAFTEHERSIIKQNLIKSCKECWNKYGYQKTNVSELCKMAGISTGAFYQFYSSKEMLFIDTAQTFGNELMELLENHLQKSPDKYGLAAGLKAVIHETKRMEWFLSLGDQWPVLMRKLPPEYMEQDFKGDTVRYSKLIEKYHLIPRKNVEEITTILQIITMGLLLQDKLPGHTDEALDFIIDTIIYNLFD